MFLKKLHALFHDIFLPIWLNEHSMKCLTFVSNEAIRMVLTLILGNRSIYFGGDTTHFVIMSYLLNYFFGYGYIKHFGYICKTMPSINKYQKNWRFFYNLWVLSTFSKTNKFRTISRLCWNCYKWEDQKTLYKKSKLSPWR